MALFDEYAIKAKLAIAKDIAKEFPINTSLGTVIRGYESRLKHIQSKKEREE